VNNTGLSFECTYAEQVHGLLEDVAECPSHLVYDTIQSNVDGNGFFSCMFGALHITRQSTCGSLLMVYGFILVIAESLVSKDRCMTQNRSTLSVLQVLENLPDSLTTTVLLFAAADLGQQLDILPAYITWPSKLPSPPSADTAASPSISTPQ
jgi:hypothetical protein